MTYAISLLILAYSCDPALTALFTPAHPRAGRYEVCTTDDPIEALAGTADIQALGPLDAFGAAGSYDRSALAQLYGGRLVRVARRWRRQAGVFVAETLISPYPDAALTRLAVGTMVIRWTDAVTEPKEDRGALSDAPCDLCGRP
jgi:hypothetical protein